MGDHHTSFIHIHIYIIHLYIFITHSYLIQSSLVTCSDDRHWCDAQELHYLSTARPHMKASSLWQSPWTCVCINKVSTPIIDKIDINAYIILIVSQSYQVSYTIVWSLYVRLSQYDNQMYVHWYRDTNFPSISNHIHSFIYQLINQPSIHPSMYACIHHHPLDITWKLTFVDLPFYA